MEEFRGPKVGARNLSSRGPKLPVFHVSRTDNAHLITLLLSCGHFEQGDVGVFFRDGGQNGFLLHFEDFFELLVPLFGECSEPGVCKDKGRKDEGRKDKDKGRKDKGKG